MIKELRTTLYAKIRLHGRNLRLRLSIFMHNRNSIKVSLVSTSQTHLLHSSPKLCSFSFIQEKEETMGINHFILALISLSCLFSFSTSADAPSPLCDHASRELFEFISNAPMVSAGLQMEKMGSAQLEKLDGLVSILPGGVDPALQQICGNTDHPVECILTTMQFLDKKAPVEPLTVLEAGIQAMDFQARDALAKATRLSQDPTTPTNCASVLQKCIQVYNDILVRDEKALEAISKRDLVRLGVELSANVEKVLGCDEAFIKAKVKSPMKEADAMLAKTTGHTLTVGLDLVRF